MNPTPAAAAGSSEEELELDLDVGAVFTYRVGIYNERNRKTQIEIFGCTEYTLFNIKPSSEHSTLP